MIKAEVRREFLNKRKALLPAELKRRSQLIAWRFFDLLRQTEPANALTTIHTFLPIQRQNEIDTWLIIRAIWTNYPYVNVVVPVTNDAQNTLSHCSLSPQTPLAENRWGIPEPISANRQIQQPITFDLVLVPLLGFDKQGNRVGHGKGFYDRFLTECRPDSQKIGLSLFGPIDRIRDVEATDIRLDKCITPTEIYDFK